MSVFRRVTKNQPCPICGKPDWCFWMPDKDGSDLICCQRHTTKEDVIGRDGEFYIHAFFSQGEGSSGASVFEEANQRRQKQTARKGDNDEHVFKKATTRTMALTPINQILPKSNEELDKIYRFMLDKLILEEPHREYLNKEGWTNEMIDMYKIVSFPEKDFQRFTYRKNSFVNPYRKKLAKLIIEEFGENSLYGVPGAYKDKSGNWTFAGNGGILFPQYDVNHKLYRLRLRMDYRDVDGNIIKGTEGQDDYFIDKFDIKWFISYSGIYELLPDGTKRFQKSSGKYRNFSSFHESKEDALNGFLVNSYDCGCEAGNNIGFYYNESRDDMFLCYITEGEKKSIYSNHVLRAPFIDIPGVGSWFKLFSGKKGERPIDVLINKGVKMFIVGYDADKSVNSRVMSVQQNTINALREEGLMIGLAEWNMALGKGMDDLLANGHRPQYISVN